MCTAYSTILRVNLFYLIHVKTPNKLELSLELNYIHRVSIQETFFISLIPKLPVKCPQDCCQLYKLKDINRLETNGEEGQT